MIPPSSVPAPVTVTLRVPSALSVTSADILYSVSSYTYPAGTGSGFLSLTTYSCFPVSSLVAFTKNSISLKTTFPSESTVPAETLFPFSITSNVNCPSSSGLPFRSFVAFRVSLANASYSLVKSSELTLFPAESTIV